MSNGHNGTVERLMAMLRKDLRLGADIHFDPETPLFGGEIDLDSLDALLLVTSIEKSFGIKVPNEAVGRDVFQNLRSIANYIDRRQESEAVAAAAVGTAESDPANLIARLPHGAAFRFVSSINRFEPGISISGYWRPRGDEPYFAAHFPGRPIVPGVFLIEALAQISGLLAGGGESGAASGAIAGVEVRFRQPIEPPAEITLESRFARTVGDLHHFDVQASSGGLLCASGSITMAFGDSQGTGGESA